MKLKIIVLILSVLPLFAVAQNQIDKQGRRQGPWTKVDKNNRKIYEGTFKDDHETGVFTYFYPNGAVRMKNTFTPDGKYCSHEVYSEKGHLLATGFYNQKNRDSVWHIYNEDGALVKINRYRMGVKWGTFYTFSPEGDTLEIFTWKDNKRHGYARRVTREGYVEMHYVDGLLHGPMAEYANGKRIKEGQFENALRVGEWKRWIKGTLSVKENWRDGMLIDRKVLVLAIDVPKFVSTKEIAYFHKSGNSNTVIMLRDGKQMSSNEDFDSFSDKIGTENFVIVDRKNKVVAANDCVKGLSKDSEGRTILELNPQTRFNIFVDEKKDADLIKMVEYLLQENNN